MGLKAMGVSVAAIAVGAAAYGAAQSQSGGSNLSTFGVLSIVGGTIGLTTSAVAFGGSRQRANKRRHRFHHAAVVAPVGEPSRRETVH